MARNAKIINTRDLNVFWCGTIRIFKIHLELFILNKHPSAALYQMSAD